VVAERLPVALLSHLSRDADWRVRWEVAQRADASVLAGMRNDEESEIRQVVAERLVSEPVLKGVAHG
jgi:hypothetical protein